MDQGVNQSLINLVSAALHLAILLKGVPYLPDDPDVIKKLLVSSSSPEVDATEIARIHSLGGLSGKRAVGHMRNTLFLSLTVSPLLLLLPHRFGELAGREKLMETWSAVVPATKPPSFAKAELAVWNLVFSAAQGGDLMEALGDAMHIIEPLLCVDSPPWLSIIGQPSRNNRQNSAPSNNEVAVGSTLSNTDSTTDNPPSTILESNAAIGDNPIIPLDGETAPSNSETAPSNSETAPSNCETALPSDKTTPLNDEMAPSNNETAPSNGETTPSNGETTPANNETAPSNNDTGLLSNDTHHSTADPSPSQSAPEHSTLPKSSLHAPLSSSRRSTRASTKPLPALNKPSIHKGASGPRRKIRRKKPAVVLDSDDDLSLPDAMDILLIEDSVSPFLSLKK
ncbi:hypothetical protein C0991_004120 [Blastosporella zonata]|nr:hypothetical protein C0991_004120 [Blastosporella zonata]